MIIYENLYNKIKAIKLSFIKESMAFTIIILGLLILVGYCYWSNHQLNKIYKTSQSYEKIVSIIRTGKPQAFIVANKFISNNKNTYGVLVALEIAQIYVNKNELNKAVVQLRQGISIVSDDNLESLINLRLARVQVQQGKADEVLKTLNNVKSENFSTIVSYLRGEALLSKGDKQGAHDAWKIGVKNNHFPELTEIMQMKINELYIDEPNTFA